jgi:hypothetical protein
MEGNFGESNSAIEVGGESDKQYETGKMAVGR